MSVTKTKFLLDKNLNFDTICTMEDAVDLKGQLYRLPDGQKVRIESQQGSPARAIVRRIGGPRAGTRAVCLVSKLEPLDSEASVEEETD